MKRFFSFLFISLLSFSSVCLADNFNSPMTDAKFRAAMPAPLMIPSPPALENSKGYVLMDANSGQVIAQKNMNERLDPASLTKMMTLYIAFSALKSGQIHLQDEVLVSEKAWRMDGSRMFVRVGTQVPVSELLQGIIVASGNDACVALAEYIAGNEETFAQVMNQTAAKLGMKNTHYNDSTGMPDPDHYSTPYDLSLLARALVQDFPEYYSYFKQQWYSYNKIKQPNRNLLLWRDPSVDGIKTGHTDAAGFCLVASAKRGNMRLISVVMGEPSEASRAKDSQALLTYGFRFYETHLVYKANTPITKARVWYGQNKTIELGVAHDFYVTTQVNQFAQVKGLMSVNNKITAPVQQNTAYGSINASLKNKIINSAPLVALANDPEGGFMSRQWDRVTGLFH
ncbi:MAG TPA: D-alanyl-D-alanine carboxypeptidase family protein [Coxiellaceae bacterium]|nr:D-alanyl-D-alanine carboxypeptidase family protein [Coxiellaceae bacterium]